MCFSVEWFAHLLVMLVLIGAAVMIARILIPYVIGWMGAGATVIMAVFNILVWAFVAIVVIYICVELYECLSSGGFGLSFPHNR
jgi:hypothetical protein